LRARLVADGRPSAATALLVVVIAAATWLAAAPGARADQRDDRLDRLFEELAEAPAGDVDAIEARIWEIWSDAPSATVDLLLERAEKAAAVGELKAAGILLDHVVALAPDFAEGWARRASLRIDAEDLDGAIIDLEHALALEPRHFGALMDLGGAFAMLGRDKAAYAAFQEALRVNPRLEAAREAAERLERKATGQRI